MYDWFLIIKYEWRGSDAYPIISQPSDDGMRIKQQLESKLILVIFLFLEQFCLKISRYYLVFTTYIQNFTQIVVLFCLFNSHLFVTFKSLPTCSSEACHKLPLSPAINKAQRLTMKLIVDKQRHGFIQQTFFSNYSSIVLLNNFIYNIFIIE